MSWTIQYRATANDGDINEFVEKANSVNLKLSWGSEKYVWESPHGTSASGFTKIQSSLRPKTDFKKIINELKRVAIASPGIRVEVVDDYVLGDWWHVLNIKLEELEL